MLLEDVVDVDVADGVENVLHQLFEFGDELLGTNAGVGVALELAVHLDPRGSERNEVQLVDGSGRVDSAVVSLLVDDVVVSHGALGVVVVVERIVKRGLSSCLSSCCDGHSLVE